MKAEDIIKQLVAVLPGLTGLFSQESDITSLTISSRTVTATTSTNHGLSEGEGVNICGAISVLPITSLTHVDGLATLVTSSDHDLVNYDNQSITISGATEPEYNGTFPVELVVNKTTIQFRVADTATSPATGSPVLEKESKFAYNGFKQVASTPTPTTFTYEIPTGIQLPVADAIGTIKVRSCHRITGASTFERIQQIYTPQDDQEVPEIFNNLWAFVVLGDTLVHRDKRNSFDSLNSNTKEQDYKVYTLPRFQIYVITPSSESLGGREPRDLMEDLFPLFIKSIARVKLPSGFCTDGPVTISPTGHSTVDDNLAFYVHEFSFESVNEITLADTVDVEYNRAFRCVDLSIVKSDNSIIIKTDDIEVS